MSNTKTEPATKNTIVEALGTLLGDSYALMAQTHLAHWNVEGPAFFELHAAFQKQYEALFETVDEVAERIRALDAYAPGGLKPLANLASIADVPSGPAPAKDFVAALIDGNETLVESAKRVRDIGIETNDLETHDMAIKIAQSYQKTLWMLKSYLKNL